MKIIFHIFLFTLCSCVTSDEDLATSTGYDVIQHPPPSCTQSTATRVSTVHHLSLAGCSITGGAIELGKWLPSAAGQTMEIPIPIDQGNRLDNVSIEGAFANHAAIMLYRLQSSLSSPTLLGPLDLQSVSPTGEVIFGINTGEVAGGDLSSYFARITSDAADEVFGPITVTTSTPATAVTDPGC
jgi:hypothetical protein